MLRWLVFTDVAGQPVGPVLDGKAIFLLMLHVCFTPSGSLLTCGVFDA